ncbi:hypothetical protein EDD29_2366 [Actinocorallia herbida]|uniref:Uncharacterized protein n=1 Tax=Actinocorallia herbida TaxID=58109 RepID=A0A3N1CU48_9ACTN|nr:GTPase-associated protein 1-related protein [Actinocorallia herbida]ROO84837.1 hypothetical protein EDD29_2366 [Actinocorallia herbida]
MDEWHYTSVIGDRGGVPGFQFTVAPRYPDPALRRQIEALVAYEPPRSAPPHPTAEEIGAFPIALSHAVFPDGTSVLSHVRYIGQDYSGRFGNFYAHSFQTPASLDVGLGGLPIHTWGSPGWGTVGGRISAHLVPDDATLLRHANSYPGLAGLLSDALRLFAPGGGRQIILVAEADEVALLLAVICRTLPYGHARGLTFTTYTRRPYTANFHIIGTCPDGEFSFGDAEMLHQYRVHHLSDSRQCSPPEPSVWGEAAAALWRAGELGVFQDADGPPDADGEGWKDWEERQGGRLAGTALGIGIPVPHGTLASAVAWAETRTGGLGPEFWDRFAARLIAEKEAPDRAALLGRACGFLDREDLDRAHAEVVRDAVLAGGAGLDALARIRARAVPGLFSEAARAEIARVLAADPPRDDLIPLIGLAALAGHAPQAAAALLPPLVADDPAAWALLLAEPALHHDVGGELERLASSDPVPVLRLLRSPSWPPALDVSGRPHLRALAEAAAGRGPADAFRRITAVLGNGPEQRAYAIELIWPDRVARLVDVQAVLATGVDALSVDLAMRALRAQDPFAEGVAHVARHLRERAGDLLEPDVLREFELIELADGFARRPAAALPGQVGEAVSLLAEMAPGTLTEAVRRRVVARLTSMDRIRADYPAVRQETAELARLGDGRLLHLYALGAVKEFPPKLAARSPDLLAHCFLLWQTVPGNAVWLRTARRLYADVLTPAAARPGDRARRDALARVAALEPKWEAEFRQFLDQHPRRRFRLTLPKLIFRGP